MRYSRLLIAENVRKMKNPLKILNLFTHKSNMCKDEYVDAYVERKFSFKQFSNTGNNTEKYTVLTDWYPTTKNSWLAQRYERRSQRTIALWRIVEGRKDPVLLFVHDNGHNKNLAEIISDGMNAINGIRPQQVEDGIWINPNTINQKGLGIGIDNINFKNNN